jgi:hypothetical protein
MSKAIVTAVFLAACVAGPCLVSAQPRNLEIYWVDVEGGAATLMVVHPQANPFLLLASTDAHDEGGCYPPRGGVRWSLGGCRRAWWRVALA